MSRRKVSVKDLTKFGVQVRPIEKIMGIDFMPELGIWFGTHFPLVHPWKMFAGPQAFASPVRSLACEEGVEGRGSGADKTSEPDLRMLHLPNPGKLHFENKTALGKGISERDAKL